MWLVTQHGFFNIVQSDDDADKALLTVKARRRKDLEAFIALAFERDKKAEIQFSAVNDYQFRVKLPVESVSKALKQMVREIDYGKTKERLNEAHPERGATYFTVWDTLTDLDEAKTHLTEN